MQGSDSTLDINEELKKSSLQKLTAGNSPMRRLDRVYNMSSNMLERATNKMKIANLNEALLPLDKDFLDFIMGVSGKNLCHPGFKQKNAIQMRLNM